MKAVRVWDFPVRLTHWLFVPLIAFSWWSAEEGRLQWHRWSGYALLGLVLFRLAWGFLGSDTARFSHFLKGPRAIVAYLSKGRDGASAGHNPLGGWSVLALLLLLIVQATLGLFAIDVDGIEAGPLSAFVDFDTARWAAKTHHLVFNVMAGLIALHLAAIAFYALFRRENLIGPMFTGRKALAEGQTPPRMGNLWLALALAVAVGVLVFAASQAFWAL